MHYLYTLKLHYSYLNLQFLIQKCASNRTKQKLFNAQIVNTFECIIQNPQDTEVNE